MKYLFQLLRILVFCLLGELLHFLHRKTKAAWCNPLLLGSIFVIVFLRALKIPYPEYKGTPLR